MSKVFLSPATLVGAVLAGALLFAGFLGLVATRNAASAARSTARPVATAPQEGAQPVARAGAAATPGVAQSGSCPEQPLLQARGGGDGRFAVEAALAAGRKVQPVAFVSVSREAAQAGRVRDAEVALLAACGLAERAAGGQSAAVADMKTELGQHYLLQARAAASVPVREQLLQRASALFSDSASAYALALGRNASKTRMAQQRVAMLRAVTTPATAAVTAPADAGPTESPAGGAAVMGAARDHAPDERASAAMREGPCSGSAARRLVCADPQLAQLDRDLQRLHAQAARVSRDRAGMRRRDSMALARESACQDKACLLRWYAQRRRQLLDEF